MKRQCPDIYLFNALIKAIPTGSKLILLGDTNQLEAIGVGNILFDMIDSEQIPVVRLMKFIDKVLSLVLFLSVLI